MLRSLIKYPKLTLKRAVRKARLAISPDSLATFTLEDGLRFTCKLGSSTGRILTMGTIEATERAFFRQELKPGQVFFDIGANLGLFTLTAAKCVGPSGRVYAFEPSAREARLLQHNIDQNGFTNVTIVRGALSDHEGEARFAVATDGGTNSLAKTTHPEQVIQTWETVPLTTLDVFVTKHQITRVNMMKIDVEGGECDVLRGGAAIFSCADAPVVLTEFCDLTAAGFNSSGAALYDAWTAYGYTLHELVASGPQLTLEPATPKASYDYANLVAIKPRA